MPETPTRLLLAPLHGVTNYVYRAAYFRHFSGFDAVYAPFILAVRSSQAKPNHFKDLLKGQLESGTGKSSVPLIPQLIGNDATAFCETARALAGLGYGEIDWNLGCPYPMVANKQRGSGLLPFPEKIGKILDAACALPGIRVSVKLRLGRSDPQDIVRLMPVLNAHPLSLVIIHPRLGTQMYKGTVDLDAFARAASLCAHPVVYNGDINTAAEFAALKTRFPNVAEWMIGRGALANPFLPEEIRASEAAGRIAGVAETPIAAGDPSVSGNPETHARVARLRAWHRDLYASYRDVLCGPAHVLDKMKEVWWYLGAFFPQEGKALERITRVKTFADYESAVSILLGELLGN
jgi:tRNA-dihydrouridine synthase